MALVLLLGTWLASGQAAEFAREGVRPGDMLVWTVKVGPEGGQQWRARVDAMGMIDLGSAGMIHVAGMTLAEAKAAIETQAAAHRMEARKSVLPVRLIRPGDVLVWSVETITGRAHRTLAGQARVGNDGKAQLGDFGSVWVVGMTPDQAKSAIEAQVVASQAQAGRAPAASKETSYARTNELNGRLEAANVGKPRSLPPVANAGTLSSQVPAAGSSSSASALKKTETNRSLLRTSYAGDEAPITLTAPPVAAGSGATNADPQALKDGKTKKTDAPLPIDKMPRKPSGVESLPATEVEALPATGPAMGMGDGVPREQAKIALPSYIIEPPDVLLIESTQALRDQPIRGQHLVRPDGTVGLGIYGSVLVAGMTLEQARLAIANQIALRVRDLDVRNLYVDVLAYNSKVYYVITDGGGYGEQVYRFPITGSETVLDAVSQINGLPPISSKCVWVARPVPGDPLQHECLPVNWVAITQCANTSTNYQVLPGDRIYVKADRWIAFDQKLSKVLSPIERALGVTLLGSETVNSIRNRNTSNTLR
jgi:polysaccharide export outer membrane protein